MSLTILFNNFVYVDSLCTHLLCNDDDDDNEEMYVIGKSISNH